MRLAQLSTLNSPSGRGAAMLALILQHSPFLASLDGYSAFELDATNFDWLPEPVDERAIQKRNLNGSYTGGNLSPNSRVASDLAIMGDFVKIDKSLKADAAKKLRDIPTWLTKELTTRARKYAIDLEDLLFNGSGAGSPKEIKGLKTIFNGTDDLPGYTGIKGVIDATDYLGDGSEDSFDFSTTAGMERFVEALMYWITEVDDPQSMYVNRVMYGRIQTCARKLGYLGATVDSFGRQVQTFDGLPFVKVRDNTIKNTEPDKNVTPVENTTSLWIAGFGEREVSVVTNSGIEYTDYDHLEAEEKDAEKWEFRGQWKVENHRRIRRVRYIKL